MIFRAQPLRVEKIIKTSMTYNNLTMNIFAGAAKNRDSDSIYRMNHVITQKITKTLSKQSKVRKQLTVDGLYDHVASIRS